MRVFSISKRNGKRRTIYAPNDSEKESLRGLLPQLNAAAMAADVAGVQHGFQPGRSPVTNALRHVGYTYTLSFDLENFFESVTAQQVPEEFRDPQCFPDGAARQGLPTSPPLANLAAAAMDAEILSRNPRGRFVNQRFVYTRYADDLTFSFNEERLIGTLKRIVPEIVQRHGFAINASKTKLQCAAAGLRHVTGIAVGERGIQPTREIKRRLRAARHQRNTAEARGLLEWCRLRIPKGFTMRRLESPSQQQKQGSDRRTTGNRGAAGPRRLRKLYLNDL
jgi:hypothetical protein